MPQRLLHWEEQARRLKVQSGSLSTGDGTVARRRQAWTCATCDRPRAQYGEGSNPTMNTSSRRGFLRSAAIAFAAAQVGLVGSAHARSLNGLMPKGKKRNQMSSSPSLQPTTEEGSVSVAGAIRPFQVEIPQEELADLRRRLEATRSPSNELVPDRSQGVQLATMKALARYWTTEYDLRRVEARLNALPQFMTEIDGIDIHFIHVRSRHENALPLIMTHGWPGSIIELLEPVGPLTDPTSHGGRAEDAFDLVMPSLPGYGFSGEPTELGWNVGRVGHAWAELMRRLGYSRYVAQGGDVGAGVSDAMGRQAPEGL